MADQEQDRKMEEKEDPKKQVESVVVRSVVEKDGENATENVQEVVVKDGAENVEEVVVKNGVLSTDTTDKRAQLYSARQANTYAAKKTVAQGMMDVALITANANQMRYLIEYQRNSPTFFVILCLIIVSLLLQVAVGVSLIFKGRFDIKGQSKSAMARKINNYVVVGVFLITIINVFIAAFSISEPSTLPSQ